jgi:menaquinone-dependent protoporphyrinogen oxidase
MVILIAVASRHGSTDDIAEAIAHELRVAGNTVSVQNADDVKNIEPYEAVIVGSAVYAGSWLATARDFIKQHRVGLAQIPVWLFSSGPLGDDEPQPTGEPNQLRELLAATGARGHTIFVGKLDKSRLGMGERLIVRFVGAPEGDFRDWEAIRGWAHTIAEALEPAQEPVPASTI